jgi:MFS family permease
VLALIISGYTVGQWIAPWLAGHIYDVHHSYRFAWLIMALAGIIGAAIIYMVTPSEESAVAAHETSVSAEVV